MPIINCSKCTAKLKVPDGVKGSVKCPKCGAVFPVSAPATPAFEVVDDAPVPKRSPAAQQPAVSAPPVPKAASAASPEPGFEIVEEEPPRKKRIMADETDDDDMPESPNERKGKKKRRNKDDENEDGHPRDSSFKAAKVGLLLLSISLWIYLGTFALLGFLVFLVWLGAVIPNGLLIVPGLLGVSNWVVALVGLGFCIAGPSKSRGLAIAATSVAGVHVILLFVVANDRSSKLFSHSTIQFISLYNRNKKDRELEKAARKNPNGPEAKELEARMKDRRQNRDESTLEEMVSYSIQYGGGEVLKDFKSEDTKKFLSETSSKMRWIDAATLLLFSNKFIAVLAYQSKLFDEYILSLLAGLVEVARLILVILLIATVARAAGDHDTATKARGLGLVIACIAIGASILLTLITYTIHDSNVKSDRKEGEKRSERLKNINFENWEKEIEKMEAESDSRDAGRKALICITDLLLLALHGGALIIPAIVALEASSAAGRRS